MVHWPEAPWGDCHSVGGPCPQDKEQLKNKAVLASEAETE